MALTDNCDIFVAVHDAGINRIARAVFRQRPSLVNLGTLGFVRNPERLCEKIDAHPIVGIRGNPLVCELPGLPVLLTHYSLEYCFQVTALELDFHPGDIVSLPPELHPPLADQRLAVHAGACFGFGCPVHGPKETPGQFPGRHEATQLARVASPPVARSYPVDVHFPVDPKRPPREIVLPADELLCTCIDIFGTLGFDFVGPAGNQRLVGRLDGIEIVDLGPTSLEDSIECYLGLVVRLGLLPKLQLKPIDLMTTTGLLSLDVQPTPNSAAVPFNPAVEDDQIKVFIDLQAGPGDGSGGGGSGGSGGGGGGASPPVDPGFPRARTRTGPFDATAALAERAVRELFSAVRDGFSRTAHDSKDFGPFRLRYNAEVHLENGDIDFRSDGTIALEELDVAFNTLELCIGLDIPEQCIGGWCILGIPFDGCAVHAPSVCFFEDDPDFEICLDLGPFLRLELSAVVQILTKYAVNQARTAGMNDWDAIEAGLPNHWQVFLDPITIDADLFDIADIIGGLLETAIDDAVDTFLGPLPGWAKDFVKSVLGSVADIVSDILDIGDDIQEWLSEALGINLGLIDFILGAVADHLAAGKPLFELPDPTIIMPAEVGLVPVLVPVEFLGIHTDDRELVVGVDLGG